jgi:hypothetical protein
MGCTGKNSTLLRAAVVVYVVAVLVIVSVVVHNHRTSDNAFVRHFANACIGLLSTACALNALMPLLYHLTKDVASVNQGVFKHASRPALIAISHAACVSTVVSACVLASAVLAIGEYTPAQRNLAAILIGFHWALLVLFMNDFTIVAIFLESVFNFDSCYLPTARASLLQDLQAMIGEEQQLFWGLDAESIANDNSLTDRYKSAAGDLIEHLQQKYALDHV